VRAELISAPTVLQAAGSPPKMIAEFVGRLATGTANVSIAVMESPPGWSEPGQQPEFDEYSIVLEGRLTAATTGGQIAADAGQALYIPAGEWVSYSTPGPEGARYVSVCLPAFSPETVHRDDERGSGDT
jgi:mannose-6-phosphate isomerase-like protein (cupin superfamily)